MSPRKRYARAAPSRARSERPQPHSSMLLSGLRAARMVSMRCTIGNRSEKYSNPLLTIASKKLEGSALPCPRSSRRTFRLARTTSSACVNRSCKTSRTSTWVEPRSTKLDSRRAPYRTVACCLWRPPGPPSTPAQSAVDVRPICRLVRTCDNTARLS